MTVETVLKEKGHVVYSTNPDALIGEVVANFARNKAGSLLVIDREGRVIGLLTERDIVKTLGEQGAAMLSLPVSAVMAKARLRCRPQTTVKRALELMDRGKTRYLPVVEEGRLVGVISMVDLVAAQRQEAQADADWMKEYISGDYSISYEHAN